MSGVIAFDVQRWIAEGKLDVDKPLMNHARVVDDRFIVMVFDGPTPPVRSDFHINTAAEFFYQFEGDMDCTIRHANGTLEDFVVGPGQLFYIPPLMPHRNRRADGSVGLVIHEQRAPGAKDTIVWYCEQCGHELHRFTYPFTELQRNLSEHIRAFLGSEVLRTCELCGWVMPDGQGLL